MPPILPPRRASVAPPETRDALALFGRQVTTLVPATYGGLNAGPDPGTVVGITLGSVGGFILIVYFVYITHMDSDLGIPEAIRMGVPVCAFSLALNLVVTAYIVLRILMTKRSLGPTIQPLQAKQLTSVSNNLIESSALYSAFGLTFVVSFVLRSNVVWLVAPMQGSIPVSALI